MLDIKSESFVNLSTPALGVSCSVVDAYYVPGRLARIASWFLEATADVRSEWDANFTEGVFVELGEWDANFHRGCLETTATFAISSNLDYVRHDSEAQRTHIPPQRPCWRQQRRAVDPGSDVSRWLHRLGSPGKAFPARRRGFCRRGVSQRIGGAAVLRARHRDSSFEGDFHTDVVNRRATCRVV